MKQGSRRWFVTMALSFGRSARQARRNVALAFVFPTIPALAMVGLFASTLSSVEEIPSFPAPSYVDWMAAGAVTVVPMVGAVFSGTALALDIRDGFMERLRLLPVAPTAFLAGRVLFDSARMMVPVAGVLGVAAALGAELAPGVAGWAGVVVMVGLWTIAYNSLFLLVAAKTGSPEAVAAVFPVFAPLTFLSSVWWPRSLMPDWLKTVTGLNPVTGVVDGIRDVLADGLSFAPFVIAVAVALGIAAVLQTFTARTLQHRVAGD